MRLWDFLIREKKAPTITCLTFGEDRDISFHENESEGLYIVNPKALVAYDSSPKAIGRHTLVDKGKERDLGPICILYEPMSGPFDFSTLDWMTSPQDKDTKNAKKAIVLANARAEAESMAVKRHEDAGRSARMETMLLLTFGLFAIVLLIYFLQSGILSDILG